MITGHKGNRLIRAGRNSSEDFSGFQEFTYQQKRQNYTTICLWQVSILIHTIGFRWISPKLADREGLSELFCGVYKIRT